MKYGSSLKITISDIWDNTEHKVFYVTLSEKPNAKAVLKETFKQIETWIDDSARLLLNTQYLSDEQLLRAAISRGLIPSNVDTRRVPELYYVESRSGNTNGHYIELFESGIRCSCLGFVNNNKCWASTTVLNNKDTYYSRNLHKWSASRENFYEMRQRDYPDLEPGSSVVRAFV